VSERVPTSGGGLKKKRGINKKLGLKSYRKKKYIKAVSYLEKALTENKNDPEVYLFLGNASLLTGDLDGARRYFRGGLLVNEKDAELQRGLSYVYVSDERIEDAISLWGEILQSNPQERSIKQLLSRLRESEDVSSFVDTIDLHRFLTTRVPLYHKLKPYILSLSISFGLLIVIVLFYVTPLYQKTLQRFYPEIVELNEIELPLDEAFIDVEPIEALYSFSEEEVRDNFTEIKKYIYRDKINSAIISLNRIMLSNASVAVKERFRILFTFIDPPDPLSIDYNPHYFEIMKEPAVFEGAYVRWTGKIANLEKDDEEIQFDLLVNYENEDTIEGIAHVSISGVYYIENRQDIEVFGTIRGYEKESGKLLVSGILIRDLRG
jgi:hypothetical protein